MTAVPLPPKVALEADTDQSMAWAREMRDGIDGQHGDFLRDMAGSMARQISTEFPGMNTGRIVMAAAGAVNALAAALEEKGVEPSVDVLVCIASLAALQLDDEGEAQS